MEQKPSESLPVYFTFRQLSVALGMNYNRLRYYCRSRIYSGIIQADAETSNGDPLFLVQNLPAIKAALRQHGVRP